MQRGFSLVELSIVLVILGLLTGGILAGQSLIRASELRAVSGEYSRYVTAVSTFRDKYFALPGDMNNATSFWGTHPSGCPGPIGGSVGLRETCNGNGNGQVMEGPAGEHYLFWQHLANAGLIEGSYSGVSGAADVNYHVITGLNTPRSRLGNATWTARSLVISGNGFWFDGTYTNQFEFGVPTGNYWNQVPVFKPEELWNIDTKMDDGRPGLGKIMANNWDACTDATASTQARTANYLLADSSVACPAHFPSAF